MRGPIGTVAAAVSQGAIVLLHRTPLDDTLDVFACHGVGGMTGMVLTGIVASTAANPDGADGLLYGGTDLFLAHLAGLVVVFAYAFFGSAALLKLVDLVLPLRVDAQDERTGLDLSQHGEQVAELAELAAK